MAKTTDDLVEDVRSLARLPDAGDPDASGILRFGDAEMVSLLAALMKSAQKEHWMDPVDTAGDGVTTRFKLPRRALDRAYRSVKLVTTQGDEIPTTECAPGNTDGARSIQVYYVERDSLVFTKAITSDYTLRVRVRRRPSQLVAVSACSAITKATSTTALTCSSTTWLAALQVADPPVPTYVDIVAGDSPHDLTYLDRLVTAYSGTAVTLDASTPIAVADFVDLTAISNDRVDYVCLRDTTCYPPLPEAGFPALVAGTALRVLQSLGDPNAEKIRAVYQERLATAMQLISPRNDEGGRAIVNRNGGLRSGGGGGWGRRTRW